MKKVSFTCFCILTFFFTHAQVFSVAADESNLIYPGIDNPLTIAVENVSAKDIVVKTDNGTITGKEGKYSIHTTREGLATVFIFKNTNGNLKKIGTKIFRILALPKPVAKVGPSSGGGIPGAVLAAQQYIRAEYENISPVNWRLIDSFTLSISRGDSTLYDAVKNNGNRFNESIISALKHIQKNDVVVFKNIFVKNMYGDEIKVAPLVFNVF